MHWYGFSPVCVLRCLIRSLLHEKALSHWEQLYGFSTVCALRWVFNAPLSENTLSQWDWYGLSPECVLWCLIRSLLRMNALSHLVYLCGFSPVCVIRCLLRSFLFEKALSHWVQLCDFSPVCVSRWVIWLLSIEKALSLRLDWCGIPPVCNVSSFKQFSLINPIGSSYNSSSSLFISVSSLVIISTFCLFVSSLA